MNLCYDFSKWIMISLVSVAISLTIGLISLAYGYIDPEPYITDPDLVDQIDSVNYWGHLVEYCYEHADRPNPLQDLKDKGFSVIGSDCKQVKRLYDEQLDWLNKMFVDYNKKLENKTK
jgi:hypothetical protein